MIIQYCDICKKKVERLDTIILFSNSFDYCSECKEKAKKFKKRFKRKIEEEQSVLDTRLRAAERRILQSIKEI